MKRYMVCYPEGTRSCRVARAKCDLLLAMNFMDPESFRSSGG